VTAGAAVRPDAELTLETWDLADLRRIVDGGARLRLAPDVEERIAAGAAYVREIAGRDRHIYGVNTGFGSLCETRVAPDQLSALQHKHLMSHACGVGDIVPERISRLAMLVKLLTFRTGHTGISLEVVRRLVDLWNHDVIPAIPKKGSVGASGDLAPLAHMALPLIGLGRVHFQGRVVDAPVALAAMGWAPVRLGPKEGLALTNGVQFINAIAADCVLRAAELVRGADLVAALSIQGFSCASTFYQAILHETSLHEERRAVAGNLRDLLRGSNHDRLPGSNVAQEDPYSFRCAPQVHAAVRQALAYASTIVHRECNSVSDNPLFFPAQDQVLCGGNLHGESTAFALDFLAIAMSELANISERRTYQLLSGQHGLPPFLVPEPGVDSGLMIVQYTSAALVNENKVLATPASIDTIPTCQLQEDHVSMGATSAHKLAQIIDNCELVLAIELVVAAQAMDLNAGLEASERTRAVHADFRAHVPFLAEDRVMATDIERAHACLLARGPEWTAGLA
jgi:histidine ammonia-lyase